MHVVYPAVLAVLLFCTGLYGVLARRNAILVLMSVELMLAGVSLNLVAFDVWLRDAAHSGQVFTLFLIALSAAEIGVGLAIVLLVYRTRGTSAIDRMRELNDQDDPYPDPYPGLDRGLDPAPSPSPVPATEPASRENPTT